MPAISCIVFLNSETFHLFPHNGARNGLWFEMCCTELNLIQPMNDMNVREYVVHAVSLAIDMKWPLFVYHVTRSECQPFCSVFPSVRQ
jgi:hypothetical protein